MEKALIAMSGGVDSSVAAYMTKKLGYECVGATMKLFDNDTYGEEKEKACCSLKDVEDARSICFKLDIPYYVFNFKEDFKSKVIDRFINAYEHGMTPNPCIDCNRYLKFEKLYERAMALDCEYVVTGHYARIEKENGRYLLKKAVDGTKDQSYVLYSLTQEQLSHTLFPLGEMSKTQAREIAEKNGFVNARKHDSQDICFVPDGDYAKVIEQNTNRKYPKGSFVSKDGTVMGTHQGIIHYTIGQRKGLGVAFGEPMYVCDICMEKNEVVLGRNEELFKKALIAENFNWIAFDELTEEINVTGKIRYSQKEEPCKVSPMEDGKVLIEFEKAQRAITKGQAVVLYDGDTVVGGGTICGIADK